MKSGTEYKLRRIGTAISQHGSVDVFLRGDPKPYRIERLINVETYGVDAAVTGGRTVTFDPLDIIAVLTPAEKPLASA